MNIILNGDRWGTKEGCLLWPFLFNFVLKVLAKAINQGKKMTFGLGGKKSSKTMSNGRCHNYIDRKS